MVEKRSFLQVDTDFARLPATSRRRLICGWVATIMTGASVSCNSACSELEGGAPFGQCQDAEYELLYPGLNAEEFPRLDMCGNWTGVKDTRLNAFSPIRVLGIGNGGTKLLVGYMQNIMDVESARLCVYDMEQNRFSILRDTINEVRSHRLSRDGGVMVGIECLEKASSMKFDVWVRHCKIPENHVTRVWLGTRGASEIPRNITISDDGEVIVLSDFDAILRLDPSTMMLKQISVGFNASCSPDGTIIASTDRSGALEFRSTSSHRQKEVVGINAIDGLEWYPTGLYGVVAEPSLLPPLGVPRPDNLYLVDIFEKRWRKLTLQRGWIGTRSLRWIKRTIEFRSVLNSIHEAITQEAVEIRGQTH